jgi:hypothetical protein
MTILERISFYGSYLPEADSRNNIGPSAHRQSLQDMIPLVTHTWDGWVMAK